MFSWIKQLLTNPRQLKDMCRKKIRHLISWNVLYNVETMHDVTEEIKEYVCIMDTEHYSMVEPAPATESTDTASDEILDVTV